MTDRIRYVDTASAGGDGTTDALSGANAAYANLNAAIDAEVGDLPTLDERVVIKCRASTGVADTVAPTFSSAWIMDSTRYVLITKHEAEGFAVKWDTSKYRIQLSTATSAIFSTLPTVNQFFAVFEGIQFRIIRTGTSASNTALFSTASGMQVGSELRFYRCIISNDESGFSGTGGMRIVLTNTFDCRVKVKNTFCAGLRGASTGFYVGSTPAPAEFYNCTFVDNATALRGMSVTHHRVKNCLFYNNTIDINGTVHTASTNNATDQATMQGADARVSQTFSFRDEAGGDYRLAASDTGAKDFGINLISDGLLAVTDDIDGQDRPATGSDIGFDEFYAEGFVLYHEDGHVLFPTQRYGEVVTVWR